METKRSAKGTLRRILLVEDDESYSKAVTQTLQGTGLQVESVLSGRTGLSMAGLNDYDLVLSDIQLPEVNGLQLLNAVKKLKPSLPIVLMSGHTDWVTAAEAKDMGAAAFLQKPFSAKSLLDLIQGILVPECGGEQDLETLEEFCEIPIDEFVSGKSLNLDLYVRLSATKYVKIANEGEPLQRDRIDVYRKRNIGSLYVSKADYEKYVTLQLQLTRALAADRAISPDRKRKFLRHASEVILNQIHLDGINAKSFGYAKTLTETNLAIMSRSQSLFSIMEELNDHADHLFAHSLAVSTYSTMLSRAMGWKSPSTLYKVSMGGLLHDVGLREVPRDVLDKPHRSRTAEEIKLYQRHPLAGVDMLKSIPDIPTEIMLMVFHHHEHRNGAGYPSGLRESSIYPLAKLICVVDELCELTIRSPGSEPKSPQDALQLLNALKRPLLDVRMLEKLGELFDCHLQEPRRGRRSLT